MSDHVSLKGKMKEVYGNIKCFNNKFNRLLSDNDIQLNVEEDMEERKDEN